MRIIAGLAKGRRLTSPGARGGDSIRPTADRAREALFSILGRDALREATVLDLFAGTGALGLEALSRGALHAVFVDKSPFALGLIRQNIETCGFSDQTHIIRHDLMKGLPPFAVPATRARNSRQDQLFDLIFIDPPYRHNLGSRILPLLLEHGLIAPGGLVIVEDDSTETLPETVGQLVLYDQRAYGDTGFWLYENLNQDDHSDTVDSAYEIRS